MDGPRWRIAAAATSLILFAAGLVAVTGRNAPATSVVAGGAGSGASSMPEPETNAAHESAGESSTEPSSTGPAEVAPDIDAGGEPRATAASAPRRTSRPSPRATSPRSPGPAASGRTSAPPPSTSVPSAPAATVPVTSTSAPPGVKGPYEVGRRHGYWVAEPDRPSARWLMPIVNSGESWSPDGTRIVYRSSWTAISIIDVRSGDKRVLVEDPGRHLSDPLWSPDGRHIAVHETQLDRPPVLLILDVSGREVARYPDWVDGQQGYSWSPDGARIAFASHRPETKSAWLSIAKVGEAATRIATGDDTQRFLGLQWSPRGTHLGWTYDEDLHLLDLSTSKQRTFALDGSPIYGHAWAPAEDRLVVWSNRLFLMRPDGSSVRTLDPAGHNASIDPVTGRIGWISGYGAGRERGIVSSPNGDEQEVVLTTAPDAAIDGLTWSPASGQFLFIQYG